MMYDGPSQIADAILTKTLEDQVDRWMAAIASGDFPIYSIPDLVRDCSRESDKLRAKAEKLEKGGWGRFDISLNVERLEELVAFASAYLKLYMGEPLHGVQDTELHEESCDEG